MTVHSELKDLARKAFQAGVDAADPAAAVTRAMAKNPPPPSKGALFIVAIGKASVGMARAALDACHGKEIGAAIAVTNYENAQKLSDCEVHTAAHPVPDENGAKAAVRVTDILSNAKADDLVIVLVSGGSSALLPAPIEGISLADKIAVNEMLLASGLEIGEMNLVRQSLSDLKGGGMLRHAAPARVVSYILSDVLGDDLRLVGSGPSVAPAGTLADARALLKSRSLWDSLPATVQHALQRPEELYEAEPEAYLIGSNGTSLAKMATTLNAEVSPAPLIGDVQTAAERIVREAATQPDLTAIAFGGETTVNLTGNGLGGRNQELAIRVGLEAERQNLKGPWVFLSGGTDGRDGPTDAAGGLVDDQTLAKLRAAGVDLKAMLANNDCYHLLQTAGDLLQIPATGTNVADLQLFLRAPKPA